MGDALKAKQARADAEQPAGFTWIVPGEIEVRNSEEPATETRR